MKFSNLQNVYYSNVSTDLLELVEYPLESAEHTLGTTALDKEPNSRPQKYVRAYTTPRICLNVLAIRS